MAVRPTRGIQVKKMSFLFASLALAAVAVASPNGGPLGDFTAHGDVGAPKIAGYATYNGVSQVYTLTAGGVNIWAKRDEFQFAYRKMKGDFIVQAQVEFVGKGTDPHRKAGIMARTSIADFDSTYMDGALHGDGLTAMQFRKTQGGDTEQVQMHGFAMSSGVSGAILSLQLAQNVEDRIELGSEAVHSVRHRRRAVLGEQCADHLTRVGTSRNDGQLLGDRGRAEQLDERLELAGSDAECDGRRLAATERLAEHSRHLVGVARRAHAVLDRLIHV